MRSEALFLNGVYESVLQEIIKIQTPLPDQILYLQPFSSRRIVRLHENPPTAERPMRLFISVTDNLAMVRYVSEIVGWDDKRLLGGTKKKVLNQVIQCLQPDEEEIYERIKPGGPKCVNLLHVRRLKVLSDPFAVDRLTNFKDKQPLSTNRTTSGGWVYVVNPSTSWLESRL